MIYRLVSDIVPDTPMGRDHIVYSKAILEKMRDLLNAAPCRVLLTRDGRAFGHSIPGTAVIDAGGRLTVEAFSSDCTVRPYEMKMSTGVIGAKDGSVVTMVSKMDQLYLEKSQ
jgi:hypothetical protein